MRTNKKVTVAEFYARAYDAGACDAGLKSFQDKKGTVKQRIRKMCEIASRPIRDDAAGNSSANHYIYVRWLLDKQHLLEGLGFRVAPFEQAGTLGFRVVEND